MTHTWTFGYCEACLKNSHKKIKMIRKKVVSGDPKGSYTKEMWVCPVCGATKEL